MPRIFFLLCAFLLSRPLAPFQAGPELERALPLHRFPESRLANPDPAAFYAMPTAVGDDYFDGTDPRERVRRHFEIARAAGARYLRCAFSWNGIEKERGSFDWTFWDMLVAEAQRSGIRLIPYVAYTPEWAAREESEFWKQPPRDFDRYGDFLYAAAERYRGRILSWEIWNEPDNKDYWTGTAEEFAALARVAAEQIREADPDAVLVLGGMAYGPGPFFRELMEEHRIDRYVDVIALHAYPESWLNERAETIFEEWIPAARRMIAENRSGADLWLNEMGYADYRYRPAEASVYGTDVFYRYEHTRAYQAAMLFKFHVMTLASGQVSLSGWYRIDDFPYTEMRLGGDLVNFHLGLVDARARPKPAFQALQFFNRLFEGGTRALRPRIERPDGSQSVLNVFQNPAGVVVVTGWLRSSEADEVARQTGTEKDRRAETVSVELPCAGAQLGVYYDAQGERRREKAQVRQGWLREIELRGDRVFIAELRCGA
jgi:hypothetical protein